MGLTFCSPFIYFSVINPNYPTLENLHYRNMSVLPVCAIFDIGKTNKKLFLFNEQYQIVWEKSTQLPETTDEDGDNCEDLSLLTAWIIESWEEVKTLAQFEVKALNFSTYGASFVYVDEAGHTLTPLYNYLKPYDPALQKQFYDTYGGEETVAVRTASPVLGNLNSGMQIYRLKYEKPQLFEKIKYCLHLPQYLHSLFTGQYFSDITSIGCHTNLWDFRTQKYHEWTSREKIETTLPTIFYSDEVIRIPQANEVLAVGVGLHDSSSALIPYLINFQEPFILLSTGTWSITLNPFNDTPLTFEELQYDCLCYMHFQGKPVKASRLFSGYEHEIQTKRLAEHFGTTNDYYKQVAYNATTIEKLKNEQNVKVSELNDKYYLLKNSLFEHRDLSLYSNYEEAYHQLILDIMTQQLVSTELVLHNYPVKRVFVDGGFSKNPIFMNLLAAAFPEMEVFAASMAQASSLGAALAIHKHWNTKALPADLIDLKFYASQPVIFQK